MSIEKLRIRIETARREFDLKRLQGQVRIEQRAVEYFSGIEEKSAQEGNDYMRVWAKKQRKKRQSDLDWAKRKLAQYEGK